MGTLTRRTTREVSLGGKEIPPGAMLIVAIASGLDLLALAGIAGALCWAGYSLAYVVGELQEGAGLIDRALVLNPNLARAWNLSGWVRIYLGQSEVAIEHLARAMRLCTRTTASLASSASTRKPSAG